MLKTTKKEINKIKDALFTIDTMYHLNEGNEEERLLISDLRKQMIYFVSVLESAPNVENQ